MSSRHPQVSCSSWRACRRACHLACVLLSFCHTAYVVLSFCHTASIVMLSATLHVLFCHSATLPVLCCSSATVWISLVPPCTCCYIILSCGESDQNYLMSNLMMWLLLSFCLSMQQHASTCLPLTRLLPFLIPLLKPAPTSRAQLLVLAFLWQGIEQDFEKEMGWMAGTVRWGYMILLFWFLSTDFIYGS